MRQRAVSNEEYIEAVTRRVVRVGFAVALGLLCWTVLEVLPYRLPLWSRFVIPSLITIVVLGAAAGKTSILSGHASVVLLAVTCSPLLLASLVYGPRWQHLPPQYRFLVPAGALCIWIPGIVIVHRIERGKAEREMLWRDAIDVCAELAKIADQEKNAADVPDASATARSARRVNRNGEIE